MTSERTFERRSVLGLVGAVGVASVTGVGTVAADEDGEDPAPTSDHLADYASPTGRIMTDGLDEAFEDWDDDNITQAELNEVIDAWNNGTRVVDYDVIDLGDIDEPTTLEREPDGEPVVYQATSDVDVDDELTIEPGVVIEFEEGVGFDVGSGPIVAQGTDEDPILFTATKAIRGWWDGIYVTSDAIENEMEHCIVEYGANSYRANLDLSSDQFDGRGAMTLKNCTLRRSGEYGLYLWHDTVSSSLGSVLRDAENNTYSYNGSGPAWVRVENAHTLDGSADVFGNDRSFIGVSGDKMREDGTWDDLGVPYQIAQEVDTDGYDWEIEAGTTIEFREDTRAVVRSDSVITWEGEQSQQPPHGHEEGSDPRITFTGTEAERGWWDGVYVNSTSSDNVIDWTVIEYGGGGSAGANLAAGNLGTGDEGRTTLKNSTLRQSGGYGLRMGYNAVANVPCRIEDAQNNTYTGNLSGAARMRTDNVHVLSGTSTFGGNDEDVVDVGSTDLDPSYLDPEEEDGVSWASLGVPYRMSGGTHVVSDTELAIDPGAELHFEETGRLELTSTTAVGVFEGTESSPILFTGTEEIPGWWDGISFQKTESLLNTMDHCIVEYGGRDLEGNVDVGGEAGATEEANLQELTNSVLRNSDAYGLYVDSRGNVGNDACDTAASGNEFENNAEGDCEIQN